jgi:NTP pyrophosphatase (non-canonical NTP hydrolase)
MKKSDRETTLATVQEWVRVFCAERGWDPYHGPKDLAIGLVTEASELLEIFRFVPEKELPGLIESPDKREQIADELADSLYFILRFAQLYNFDLSQALAKKLIKNEIKYPKP